MSMKSCIWGGMFVGSGVGSFIPLLWGGDVGLSFASIIWNAVGGFVGILAGVYVGRSLGL